MAVKPPGYAGLVQLESALRSAVLTTNTSDTPVDADSAPGYRVYGASGVMDNGTGSLSAKESGTITGATNASPIVITSANHKLTNGVRVVVSGVLGNTAANGTFVVANVTSNTFELQGSSGNGTYTSGGTWHTAGLYDFNYTPAAANGFVAGQNYVVLVTATIGGINMAAVFAFTVT